MIFFVTTMGSIYDRVLPLIEEKKDHANIVVVATTDQIEQFFTHYTSFKVIRTTVHPDLINKKIWYKFLTNVIRSKTEYNTCFKQYKNSEIYFFGSAWSIIIYSYVQKLAKYNTLFQYPSVDLQEQVMLRVVNNYKTKLMNLFTKIFLNLNTIVVTDSAVLGYELHKKFYKKNNVHIVKNHQMNYALLDKYMVKLDEIKNKQIFMPIEDLVACSHLTETEFTNKMNRIVDILDKTFPELYVVKPHPRLNTLYGDIKTKTILPIYIPAEFIMKHPWKFIIGVESFSLVSAAKQSNATVISLIKLFDYKNPDTQQKWNTWLYKETNGRILFPESLQELHALLTA